MIENVLFCYNYSEEVSLMTITFDDIYNSGTIVESNDLFDHRRDEGILSRYDSNFLQLKKMPNEAEIQQAIDFLTTIHLQHGQHFVKLKFPANEVPHKDLLTYLEDYTIGYLELYTLQPHAFHAIGAEVDVQFVGEAQLDDFLQLQYTEDLHFGEQYAKEKQGFLRRERQKEGHHQIIAYKNNVPVGSVELIETKDTIEIDNFFVISTKRGQGIGAAIQQFIVQYAKNKTIILVADGEDDARNMYKKQGYIYQGFQYEALCPLTP